MRHVVFDVESDDLLPKLTVLHSLVLRDMDSDEVMSCADQPGYTPIAKGLKVLQKAERLYGHNIIAFDIPAITKLHPDFKLTGRVLDTYITAAMRWAHIKETDFALFKAGKLPGNMIGRHSLEAWGHRLGIHKGDCTDYSVWTPEMQTYCEQDTAVTKTLALRIRTAGVSVESVETEHELAQYLWHQERNGWPFDIEKARTLQASLAGKRQALDEELRTMFEPWQVSTGIFTPKRDDKKRAYVKDVPIERFKTVEFNPQSRDHIANRLIELYDWKPTQFTPSGKPEADENTLKGMEYPPVVKLREYLLLSKRLGQISEGKEAWMSHAVLSPQTGLSHIHGRVLQSGAVTHRAAHAKPNIAQVPRVTAPYGAECRSLFRVPDGWIELGADASGLELRCLAHYMAKYDDGEYGASVLAEKPNDVHTRNANVLSISRDDGKTFVYALLYGAGDEKLGKILAPGKSPKAHKSIGAKARKQFFRGVPALKLVSDAVQKSAERGYLHLIDGRRCYIRSTHAALNSLLQGTGAVICKRWIVEFNRSLITHLGPQGWDGDWAALGWIHDEVQLAVRPNAAAHVGDIIVQSIRDLTQHFNFRVPLDGEAKTGANWKDCH